MKLFSKEAVNAGRQPEMDLLRGFTAILLIIVHVGLYLGSHIGKGLWVFCDIAGSEPCAPTLMALMGISMVYSRRQGLKALVRRGLWLLSAGYVLNFVRSLLPLWIVGNVDEWASVEAFFVVDILQFAGLTFLFVALLKKLRLPHIAIFALSLAMAFLNQFIMLPESVPWNSELLTGIVNLFCPVTEWSCFPFLTWFVFPAFGLVFGDWLTRCTDLKKLYSILLPVGLCGTVYMYIRFDQLYPDYTTYYWGNNFYYMGVTNALLALAFFCFALSLWHFSQKLLPDFIKNKLHFLSVNLNTYYIISWILISVLMHAQAVNGWQFGNPATIGIMVLLVPLCAWLTKRWIPVKNKILRKNKA